MLNISNDIVCDLIARAREFHAKEEVVIPEELPDTSYETDWSQILADHADDLTYQELKSIIEELEPDQQLELVALMFLGRGDYSSDEWDLALEEATNVEPNSLADFLLTIPLVSFYLEKGLNELGQDCET